MNSYAIRRDRRKLIGMTLSSLRLVALAGMVALLVGAAACAETSDTTQDDSIEALQTRANAGDADAQYNLGVAYSQGQGVPQDDVEAEKWFRQAAEQGHAAAQYILGLMATPLAQTTESSQGEPSLLIQLLPLFVVFSVIGVVIIYLISKKRLQTCDGLTPPSSQLNPPIERSALGWYLESWKKYAVFAGRARRKEFWLFALGNEIIVLGLGLSEILLGITAEINGSVLGSLFQLASLVPAIAVSVRRLHDTDHSGWWMLVPLAPFAFFCLEGSRGPNRFGDAQKWRGLPRFSNDAID
jgi:uncharacterized membrane protein YhaH (DUF805 family)